MQGRPTILAKETECGRSDHDREEAAVAAPATSSEARATAWARDGREHPEAWSHRHAARCQSAHATESQAKTVTEAYWTDEAWKDREAVTYRCELSALYHRKRQRFFGYWQRVANALALGAAAIGFSAFGATVPGMVLAAIAALVAILSVVFGWGDLALVHAHLASRFIGLRAELEAAGTRAQGRLDEFAARAFAIEAEEPPALSALVRICQNELARARGASEFIQPLTHWERLMAHFVDFHRLTGTRASPAA